MPLIRVCASVRVNGNPSPHLLHFLSRVEPFDWQNRTCSNAQFVRAEIYCVPAGFGGSPALTPQNSGSAPPTSPRLQKLEPPVFFSSPPSFPQPIITITTIVSHPLPPEPVSSPSNHNGLKRFLQVPARGSPVGCAPCAAALLHRRQTARPRCHCCSSRCRPCRSAGSWCQDHGLCRSQGGCLW